MSPEPNDVRVQMMRLTFVTEEEQQKLVASWDRVKLRDGGGRMLKEWCQAAGLEDSYRVRVWARSLLRLGICRPDGTIDPEVAKVLAARAITRMSGPRRKTAR